MLVCHVYSCVPFERFVGFPRPPPGHSVEEVCTGVALKAQTVLPLVVLLPVFVNGQWLHWLRVEGL